MKKVFQEIIEIIASITVPECPKRDNSEYHLGFNSARIAYAEKKLEAINKIKKIFNKS